MNNSVVFNKIHMRNRIFNLHLFLSCSFMKSRVRKLLCLVFSSEQSQGMLEPSVAPAPGETRLSCPAQNWAASGGPNSDVTPPWLQREESINIASWAALPTRRAGRYLHNGWEVALWPSSEGSTPLWASVSSSGFGSSQPGGFLRLHTPGAWHLRRWELHLTETSLSSFQMRPMDKPSIPCTKSGLWSQNSSSPFKAYQRLQLIPIVNR